MEIVFFCYILFYLMKFFDNEEKIMKIIDSLVVALVLYDAMFG